MRNWKSNWEQAQKSPALNPLFILVHVHDTLMVIIYLNASNRFGTTEEDSQPCEV